MCMIDYDGDELALLASKTPVAAKPHRCGECDRQIGKGEKYHYDAGVVGRDFAAYRTCAHCHAARGWLADRCGGWVYLSVYEDLLDHWRDGHREAGLGRMIVGMRRRWARFGQGLMDVPGNNTTKDQGPCASTKPITI